MIPFPFEFISNLFSLTDFYPNIKYTYACRPIYWLSYHTLSFSITKTYTYIQREELIFKTLCNHNALSVKHYYGLNYHIINIRYIKIFEKKLNVKCQKNSRLPNVYLLLGWI